jgi:hypothetical protein
MSLYRWILIWFTEIRKVNRSSRTKHTDIPFELNNEYLMKKAIGHIDKWWKSGYRARNAGPGAHHWAKVMWYGGVIMEAEKRGTNIDMRKR